MDLAQAVGSAGSGQRAAGERPVRGREPDVFDRVRAVADAILYEGYLLYPYRRSSGKNQVRWQFGVLAPRQWIEARGPVEVGPSGSAESWFQQTECLLAPAAWPAGPAPAGPAGSAAGSAADSAVGSAAEGAGRDGSARGRSDGGVDAALAAAELRVRLRFLRPQTRSTQRRGPGGEWVPVEQVGVGDRVHLAFTEAVPVEADLTAAVGDLLGGSRTLQIAEAGAEEVEQLTDDSGALVGRVVRRREPITLSVRLQAWPVAGSDLVRLRVTTANEVAPFPVDATREQALGRSAVATHTILGVRGGQHGGRFVSLLDPPEAARRAVHDCVNLFTFPVLAGEPGSGDLLLSSPIILPDHPQVAPESPGDLHDASEIDELLSLRTLTLSEDELREARATDPRAARIVDRVTGMPPEVLGRLHGAVRSLRPAQGSPPAGATGSAGATGAAGAAVDAGVAGEAGAAVETEPVCPWTDSVQVGGTCVTRGSRVRLRPRGRGADAHDMFVEGRTAHVEGVFTDVDGSRYLAVILDDDPARDLNRWYGRFRYFSPDEVEPCSPGHGSPDSPGSPGRGTAAHGEGGDGIPTRDLPAGGGPAADRPARLPAGGKAAGKGEAARRRARKTAVTQEAGRETAQEVQGAPG